MGAVLLLMLGVLMVYVSIGTDLLDYVIKGEENTA